MLKLSNHPGVGPRYYAVEGVPKDKMNRITVYREMDHFFICQPCNQLPTRRNPAERERPLGRSYVGQLSPTLGRTQLGVEVRVITLYSLTCRRAGRTRVRLDPQMEDKNKELYCTWMNTCETRLHMVVSKA